MDGLVIWRHACGFILRIDEAIGWLSIRARCVRPSPDWSCQLTWSEPERKITHTRVDIHRAKRERYSLVITLRTCSMQAHQGIHRQRERARERESIYSDLELRLPAAWPNCGSRLAPFGERKSGELSPKKGDVTPKMFWLQHMNLWQWPKNS